MSIIPRTLKVILLLDAILYLWGVTGIYLISQKADLPFQTNYQDSTITINQLPSDADSSLNGQVINSIDGYKLCSPEETETYLDGFKVGDKVKLFLSNQTQAEVKLVNYYSFLLHIAGVDCRKFFFCNCDYSFNKIPCTKIVSSYFIGYVFSLL